eukprot:s412_g24.t1
MAHPGMETDGLGKRLPSAQDLDVTVLAFAQWLSEMKLRSNSSLQQMLAEMGIIRNGITTNNTDLTEFKRNTATVQQQMQSQISDLRDKLTDAYTEIANMKKTKSQFEQEVHAECQSLSEQLHAVGSNTLWRSNIQSPVMVLTALVAAGAGVTGLGAGTYLTWERYPKPFIVKKILQVLPGFLSKSLAGSPCSIESVDFLAGLISEIKLGGVQIGNVEPYKSTSLLKFDSIIVKVDLKSFAKSGFKRLVIESLCLDGLTLTVEKQGLQTSNVTDLVAKLKKEDQQCLDQKEGSCNENPETPEGGDMISNVVDASKQAVNVGTGVIEKGANVAVESAKAVHENAKLICKPGEKEESNAKQMQVIVKQLQIRGIKLEAMSLIGDVQTPTMELPVADIKYDDFSSHAARPEHIIRLILEQIVFSSLSAAGGLGSIAVESATSSAWWIFEQIGEAVYSAYSSVASLFSTADVEPPAVQQEG